ncbi:MAG: hypothetical protein KCHDKBKB_01758 [Elusimicrobia bacterium]|nr:hypothetical protein [Elusimicrobiota bacterium]
MSETSVDPKKTAIEGEVLAAIAAAVAISLKRPHKILTVEETSLQLEAPMYVLNPWSMEGRFHHFGSHKVR